MEKHATGVVTDCLQAAIYKEPRANSEIVKVITALTRVTVDLDKSTDGFYRISTSKGIQGYCMKKFISVRR